jgi:hypothetical protein
MPLPQLPQPQTFNGDLADPPKALARLCSMPNWVLWKWQLNEKGDWTKPPYKARNPKQHAKSNNPETWSDRHAAVNAVLAGKADGIGFALTDTEFGAVDLDHCRDPKTGAYDEWAQRILDAAPNAYKETTVSGTGLRIIGIAVGPEVHRAFSLDGGSRIEIFRRATRYITVSGLELGHCGELPNIDRLIDDLVAQYDGARTTDGRQAGAGNDGDDVDDLIKHGASEGQRSEAFARCVWSLAGQGLTQEEIEKELSRYPDGIASKYGKRLNREINRCYEKWWEENQFGSTTASHNWNDPDWSILDERRGELPAFPVNAVPGGDIIALCAHGAGVSFDHVAVPLLATASGVIGAARYVKPSRSWAEPAALWAAMVGLSGTGKTPGINVSKRALVEVERKRQTTIDGKRRSHEAIREAAKLAREQWKAKLKETAGETVVSLDQIRDIKAAEPMPVAAEDPGPFIEPRLFISDSTIERLAQLISAHPSGALLIIDELAALFLNLSRYSGGSDREFWLQAWNGDAYRVERMGREPVDLDHLLVGIIGGLQPDKLSRSFQGDHDGIYARILFSWPPEPPYRPLTDDVDVLEPAVVDAIDRLAKLVDKSEDGGFAAHAIPLTDGARRLFEDFRQHVHFLQGSLDGRERDWAAKMPPHALRLALTLCLLDYGFRGGAEPTEVNDRSMDAAIGLVRNYFFPHARAALRQIGLSEKHATARRVLRWIRANRRNEISIMDIRREALAQGLDKEQTLAVIESLEKAGWLRETTVETGARGKPARRWSANPKLRAENADNAENRGEG